ncbi:hypothetical protein PHLH7_25960 [Pseudomonas sp. Ost2]|uniref:hypothetical protein n=1 Tax=Pseudomonas sp. Ost2 TaxID=2678260 RepID=UPI001BB3D1BF|nr:hypothetical protein [Pseudomonas sp. Ost2]BBP76492.1 hypothetical protein PHLH7_25960 [Pseudomonas sp. Ost2]
MAQNITIRNESDAFEAIQTYLQEGGFKGNVKLSGWPKLEVRLVGEKFDATITPPVMKSFLELQNLVYKSYAIAQYDTDDTRKLSSAEREELEILIKVEEGSSIFEIDFQGVLEKFAQKAAETMSPELIAITVIGLGVLWVGKASYGAYLDYRKEVRLGEAKTEEQRNILETMKESSREETKRMELMTKLMVREPKLEEVSRQAYDSKTEMLKGFAKADTATMSGITTTGEEAQELVVNARRRAVEQRLDGFYRVLRVDSSDPEAFKVKIRRHRAGTEFEALVEDITLNAEQKEILQYAEWERTIVYLSINAKILDESIKSAVVIGVERRNPPEVIRPRRKPDDR